MREAYCSRCDGLQRVTANSVPCTRCGGSGYEPRGDHVNASHIANIQSIFKDVPRDERSDQEEPDTTF